MSGSVTAALECPTCGSAVPLREGSHATCAHCGALVEIPAAHRELRALARAEEQARRGGEALARGMVPAPWILRRLAWFVDSGVYLIVVFLLGPALALVPLFALFNVADFAQGVLGFDLIDLGQATGMLLVAFGSLAFAVGGVPILATFGRRVAAARLELLRSLAARPLDDAGVFGCRGCGAPLEIDAADPVERCAYCRTDNLRLPALPELRQRSESTHALRRTIAEAAEDDARERRDIGRRARRGLFWTAAPVLAITSLGVAADVEHALDPGPDTIPWWFSEAFDTPRRLHFHHAGGTTPGDCRVHGEDARGPQRPHYTALELPATFIAPGGCRIEHGVALRQDERVQLRVVAAIPSTDREPHSRPPVAPTYEVRFGDERRTAEVGEALELVAGWHGWFRLELSSDYGSGAEIHVSLGTPD